MPGSFILLAFVFGTLGFAGYKHMKEIETEPVEVKKAAPVLNRQRKSE